MLDGMKRGCPYGDDIAKAIEGNDDTARIDALETAVTALSEKLEAVLSAEAADSGKTLQIDSVGNVALVTV